MISEADFETIALGRAHRVKKSALGDAYSQMPDDGTPADAYLTAREKDKPHWFEIERSSDDPPNLAEQGRMVKELGEAEAAVVLDAKWGMKLGTLAAPKSTSEQAADLKGVKNPYAKNWHGEDRQKVITDLIRRLGTKAVAGIAAAAGKTIDGRDLRR